MLIYLFDLLFVLIFGAVAYALSKRSLVEVAVVWFVLVVASLIALNTFEPVAHYVATNMFAASDEWFYCYMWFASLVSIFALAVTLVLMGVAKLLEGVSPASGVAPTVGRWGFSLLSGYTFAAFLLTSMHTFPGNRDLGGLFPPELHNRRGPILALAPDYQLLSLTELICTPRAALTGAPWRLEGPLVETSLSSNRWSSFPIRYALWREAVDFKLNDYDLLDDVDESDGYQDSDAESVVALSI